MAEIHRQIETESPTETLTWQRLTDRDRITDGDTDMAETDRKRQNHRRRH